MTTTEMSAEIFRCLSILADNEKMLPRVVKYLRKLVKEQQHDITLMSKEAFLDKLEQAENSIANGKGKSFDSADKMNEWLNSL